LIHQALSTLMAITMSLIRLTATRSGTSIPPLVSTPIMLQEVESDGATPIGNLIQVLDRDASDGLLVEAPDIIRTAEGIYILFHSSHCLNPLLYDVRYATATNVMGPYMKNPALLLATGDYRL